MGFCSTCSLSPEPPVIFSTAAHLRTYISRCFPVVLTVFHSHSGLALVRWSFEYRTACCVRAMSDKPQSPFDRFQAIFRPQADPRTAQDRAPRPPPNSHDTPDLDDGHAGDAAPALALAVAPGSPPLAAGVSQSSTNLRAARDPPAAQPASPSLLAPDSASASASAPAPPDSSSLSDRAFGLSSYEPYVPLRPTVRRGARSVSCFFIFIRSVL